MTSLYAKKPKTYIINGITYKEDARTGIPTATISPKPTIKEDTTYYNNPHVKYLDIFPRINPSHDDQYLSVFGTASKRDLALNEKFLQDEAVIAQGNTNVSDELRFGSGTSWTVPYIKKAKIFQFGMSMKHLDYLAYNAGNNRQLNERIAEELSADLNLYRYTKMNWMTGYLSSTTTDADADLDWKFPFAFPAGTGSATEPVMIQEHANNGAAGETIGDQTAHIMTNDHDAAKTKDFVNNTFGEAMDDFDEIRNEDTGEKMLNDGHNTFSVFCHPKLIRFLKRERPSNGVQDDMNTTYYQQAMDIGITEFVPCYSVDAAMSTAQDGTIQYVIAANVRENVKKIPVADYMVNPFESSIDPLSHIKHWYKHAWDKMAAWVKPFTVDHGTTFYKALGHYQFKYSS